MKIQLAPRGLRLGMILALAAVLTTLPLQGQDQTTTATLRGTVTDASGAVLAGATVIVTGQGNGISRTQTTDDTGAFVIRLLPPATYSLKVVEKGFKSYEQAGIALLPAQTAAQDVHLSVGQETEVVEVTGQAPLLNTSDANLSAEIGSKQVVELPLNLRNIYGLATLNSSVQNTTQFQSVNGSGTVGNADQDISFLAFGGGFFGTSGFLLDGIWDTASDWGGVVYVPAVDSVDEFKIQTNSFTSQYGFSTGNVINVTTKSGTSSFHGDAYEFFRDSALDATPYFGKKTDFRRNQYGISAGGPIYIPGLYQQRNKTFVFGLYEAHHESTPSTFTGTVPTANFLTGDFSALLGSQIGTDDLGRPVFAGQIYNPYSGRAVTQGQVDPVTGLTAVSSGNVRDPYPGNVIPTGNALGDINSVGAALASFYPAPTNSALTNNFTGSAASPFYSKEFIVRVDHNLSDSTRLYARYAGKHEQKTNSAPYYGANDPGGPGNTRPNNRFSAVLGGSHIFNPTTAFSMNVGFQRWGEGSNSQSFPFDLTSVGLPGALNSSSPIFPIIRTGGGGDLGPVQGNQGIGFRNVGSLSTEFTKTINSHDLSFGFMGVMNGANSRNYPTTEFDFGTGETAGPDPTASTGGTGYSIASLLVGATSGGSTSNNFQPAYMKHYWGFNAQDAWRATRSLTMTLGLRYEWQAAPTERLDRQAFFDPNAQNPISSQVGLNLPGELVFNGHGERRGLYNPRHNVAPRFGFSERVSQKLVVRGGYGIFYAPAFFGGAPNPGFSQSTSVPGSTNGGLTPSTSLSNPFPNGLLPPTGNSLGGLTDVGQGLGGLGNRPSHISPYVQEYSVGVQYALATNDVVTISYVGNHGVHLLANNIALDQLSPSYYSLGAGLNALVPNPFFGAITSSSCGLDQPMVVRGQLLRPFPQYCYVSEQSSPAGFSKYNALQVDYNHRFHNGLNMLVSYTYSKFVDNVDGTANWATKGNSGIRNFYDLNSEKAVDGGDTPHSLVVNYIYELPFGKNKKFGSGMGKAANAVVGGWQLSGITTIKSGIPLGINGLGNNVNLFGGNTRPDLVGDPNSGTCPGGVPRHTLACWFNTTAFAAPAPYTFGNVPRFMSSLRAPYYQNWDLAIQKYWHFTENVRLQGRVEMFNAFNHTNFYAPDTNASSGSFGKISQAYGPRDIQLGVKLYW